MPLYEVEHSIHLSQKQRDSIAQAITQIHTRKFTTPSFFVGVRFSEADKSFNYVGGEPRAVNRIIAHVRTGGNRTTADFEDLSMKIYTAWNDIINKGETSVDRDRELQKVLIMDTIIAGIENQFLLPRAGKDTEWLKDNFQKFKQLAEQGNSDFMNLLDEMQTREDLVANLKQ